MLKEKLKNITSAILVFLLGLCSGILSYFLLRLNPSMLTMFIAPGAIFGIVLSLYFYITLKNVKALFFFPTSLFAAFGSFNFAMAFGIALVFGPLGLMVVCAIGSVIGAVIFSMCIYSIRQQLPEKKFFYHSAVLGVIVGLFEYPFVERHSSFIGSTPEIKFFVIFPIWQAVMMFMIWWKINKVSEKKSVKATRYRHSPKPLS